MLCFQHYVADVDGEVRFFGDWWSQEVRWWTGCIRWVWVRFDDLQVGLAREEF